jgi:membrane-bound metal-dependent hydrolase YbcI (DUF457 family)
MFVGHYGVSFAAKKVAPSVSLATLFIAVQLLDVGWSLLVLLGVEKVRIVPGLTATNPLDLYYMPFTHSLLAALLWSAAAFLLYRAVRPGATNRPALVVATAVFSHWVLDFLVHPPDLPLYDDSAKVGLGLWDFPAVALGLEAILLFGGLWLYFRTGVTRRLGMLIFAVLMVAIQVFVFFGPPPASGRTAALTALASYLVFAGVIAVLERRERRP